MKTVVYPGSFDPVTNGHVDIAQRAAKLFDRVVVAVGVNASKQPMFSEELRIKFLRKAFSDIHNIEVVSFKGLLVDAVKALKADAILRGIRTNSDFEYEYQMAQVNQRLAAYETIFLPADPALSFVSSSMIRELIRNGRDISAFVPKHVAQLVNEERDYAHNKTYFELR